MNWAKIIESVDWQAFADGTVKGMFGNLDSDAKRVQAWLIVQTLMNMYPQLDVYTHEYENFRQRTGFVFGRKKTEPNSRGKVCFMLIQEDTNLPRLEPRQINDIQAPTLNFTLDDNEESIERKVSDFFSQETIYEKKAINDRFNDDIRDAGELPNNRVRHLPSNYKKDKNAVAEPNTPKTQQANTTGSKTMNHPLNVIFFGPPGTGKTYTTVERAVEICDPNFAEANNNASDKRKNFRERYQELVTTGQVVFTTFHQSYSYEDFIEGIRAETTEDGDINYIIKSGIFKELCKKANEHLINPTQLTILEQLKIDAEDRDVRLQTLARQAEFMIRYNRENDRFDCSPLSSNNTYGATVGNIETYLVDPTTPLTNKSYVSSIAGYIIEKAGDLNLENFTPKKFVIIIDEINRGNISRIFGELITLIEDSKRLGHKDKEDLSVKLPYSQESFSVPNNVYIIGTMNTADRSLAGLDLALRRRFDFKEMMPDVATLKGIKVGSIEIDKLLTVINQRIEVLLDREHTIGHAYFIGLKSANANTITDLASIFKNKVIPLLQEYFYEDWEKINMVLGGNKFVTKKEINSNLFLKSQNDTMQLNSKTIWSISGDDVFAKTTEYTQIYAPINNGA